MKQDFNVRHRIIDLCLKDRSGYSIKDILNVLQAEGITATAQQIAADLKFMQNEADAPVEKLFGTKPLLYRYEDKNYSIFNHTLSKVEKKQLIDAVTMLGKYKDNPDYAWVEEVSEHIYSNLHLQEQYARPIVGFGQNKLLRGMEHFTPLFNAIKHKTVLQIKYHPFNPDKEFIYIIHPYFLKQYNERWFLFGWNEKENMLYNLALDRIEGIETTNFDYQDTGIDFENEYFGNIIGVTFPQGEDAIDIILKVSKSRWGYLKTKPIHASQKLVVNGEYDNEHVTLKIHVIPNNELYSALLFFGEDVVVEKPLTVKKKLLSIIERMKENYVRV
jgi:predicted DNA-binding transcriptional regulator YafY